MKTIAPIVVEPDVVPALVNYLREQDLSRLTLVADDNTYAALGERVAQALTEKGIDLLEIRLEGEEIVPDERFVMQVLEQVGGDRRTYLAVGSGVVTDIVRFVSHRTGKDFISIPTAPSVDGYTSVSSALVLQRIKKTVPGQPPVAIFADLETLSTSPRPMIAAGFGDVIAKYTSVADWTLGGMLWNAPYDASVADRARRARNACADRVELVGEGTWEGVQSVFDALSETGLCMLAIGASYPAGGSEHYVSHYWEMKLLQEDRPALLHGAKVGVGTVYTAGLYEALRKVSREQAIERLQTTPMPDPERDRARIRESYWSIADSIIEEQAGYLEMSPADYEGLQNKVIENWDGIQEAAADVPSSSQLASWLRTVGGPVTAADLGFTDAERDLALSVSHFMRERFTVYKLSRMLGLIG
ncbi:MAG: sn-glycerol-1-phosphate dehydrogenase [Chloroflexota bacterium]|nr:sn-glycerol-1-phosphate dehydrogenase [Chloroflexota bacterium]